ncbi:MAG: prolyl oligopeptidase family serine peptidase [Rhodospirillales bacterium]
MVPIRALDGPRILPEGGARPDRLVVFLHGIGADGNDLIGLAPLYHGLFPRAAFVAPNAPFPYDLAPFGYMWFSLQDFHPTTRWDGVRAAQPALEAFLAAELARHQLAPETLILIGFSQGAMMALHVGLRTAVAPAAILSHSGILVGAEHLADEIRVRPPVLLTHGADDDVLPAAALSMAEIALQAAGVPVEAHVLPGLGHGIDENTLRLAFSFLARHVLGQPA